MAPLILYLTENRWRHLFSYTDSPQMATLQLTYHLAQATKTYNLGGVQIKGYCLHMSRNFQTITEGEGTKRGKYLTLTLQSGAQSMFVTLLTFFGTQQRSMLQHTFVL